MRKPRIELLALPFLPLSSAVGLSSFQIIVTNSLSRTCLNAYGAEIPGCQRSDFTIAGPCSAACIAGLQEIGSLVGKACGGVVVSSSTLLGTVLEGKIVAALCPNIPPSSAPTSRGGSVTTDASTTILPRPTTKTLVSSSSPPSPLSSLTSSSFSSSPSSSPASSSHQSTPTESAAPTQSYITSFKYLTSLMTSTRTPSAPSSATASTPPGFGPGIAGSPFQGSALNEGRGREQTPRGLGALVLIGTAAVIWWF